MNLENGAPLNRVNAISRRGQCNTSRKLQDPRSQNTICRPIDGPIICPWGESMRLFFTAAGCALAALVSTLAAVGASAADNYPSRNIVLVVPFPPGGSTTVMARNVSDKMSAALGHSDRRGEPRRGWRHHRHAFGGEGGARRLYDSARIHRHACDRAQHVCECRLRSAQGLRADRDDRSRTERAGRAPLVAGAFGRRADQIRQGRAGSAAIWVARRRHRQSSRRRAAGQQGRH